MSQAIRSGFWFLVVGVSAGLTHFAAFFLLKHLFAQVLPEILNFFAFCVAFGVSFLGHRNLSFNDTTSSVKQSLGRFIVASLAGLAGNSKPGTTPLALRCRPCSAKPIAPHATERPHRYFSRGRQFPLVRSLRLG